MAPSPLVLYAMVQGVFHQGLQGQLQDLIGVQLLRDMDGVFQDILVAELLDLKIAADMGLLLLHRDIIPALA